MNVLQAPAMAAPDLTRVNRAPVLTLWAAIAAERLGPPPNTALGLASAIAGTVARTKGEAPRAARAADAI